MSQDAALFFRAWLKAPLSIAAIAPSSPVMGERFARLIDLDPAHPVLELGAGTGAVSRVLLDAGLPASKLVLMEREPALARVLRREFPRCVVIEGGAERLDEALGALGIGRVSNVVSTLPIIWFPFALQRAVVEQSFARLHRRGALLQVTNQLFSPLPARKLGLAEERAAFVWRNLPPSSIWRYRRTIPS